MAADRHRRASHNQYHFLPSILLLLPLSAVQRRRRVHTQIYRFRLPCPPLNIVPAPGCPAARDVWLFGLLLVCKASGPGRRPSAQSRLVNVQSGLGPMSERKRQWIDVEWPSPHDCLPEVLLGAGLGRCSVILQPPCHLQTTFQVVPGSWSQMDTDRLQLLKHHS